MFEHQPLTLTPTDEYDGTLAVSGDHLLTTWNQNADVELNRFSFDGGRLLRAPLVLPGASAPRLSMHGTSGGRRHTRQD